MTGLEIVGALELIRRGMKAANGIRDEADEFGELLNDLKDKILPDDDEEKVEAKVEEAVKEYSKRRRIPGRYAGLKRL